MGQSLTAELNERGVSCCVHTVAKVMKAQGIRAKMVRRFVRTTDSKHRMPVAENVLGRDFSPAKTNTAWAADITYIPTLEGWLFLALVVDLFSRRIVGWSMAATMTSRLVVDALDMAVCQRGVTAGVVAHSDRGSQYASDHYQSELRRHGMVGSRSGVGQCWDNAVVESTFGSLKRELVHHESYATREEARVSLFEYIESVFQSGPSPLDVGVRFPGGVRADAQPGTPLTPCPLSVGKIKSVFVYGFAHPRSGRGRFLILPKANAECRGQALSDFAGWADLGGRKVLVVVLDGSGGHTAKGLKVPPNVVLPRQPSCTPELQPAEHLWPLVREGLANRVFETLPKLTKALTARCQWLADHPTVVGGAIGFHWAVAA